MNEKKLQKMFDIFERLGYTQTQIYNALIDYYDTPQTIWVWYVRV